MKTRYPSFSSLVPLIAIAASLQLTAETNTWTFTESSGVLGLTVIPEPRAALLGGIGLLMLLRRRRCAAGAERPVNRWPPISETHFPKSVSMLRLRYPLLWSDKWLGRAFIPWMSGPESEARKDTRTPKAGAKVHDPRCYAASWTLRTVFTLILPAAAAFSALAEEQRPDILFIFSDDHSLQTIGAYDWRLSAFCREHKITPNIDRLARQGGLFINSYCGNSICAPSRASVLTGLHSHAHGVRNILDRTPIHPHLWTFPDGLRKLGYQTSLIGKFHIENSTPTFDEWSILPGQGDYYDPAFIEKDGTKRRFKGYVADIITDRSIEWLRERDRKKPFFLAVQHKAPHRIWEVPQKYARWLDDVTVPEPETLFDDFASRSRAEKEAKMTIAGDLRLNIDLKVGDTYPRMWSHLRKNPLYRARNEEFARLAPQGDDLTRWKYQQYMKDYLRTIKSMDDNIGRLLDELKAQGSEDNTIVIYSSDQGFFNGEHGWFDKRWIYRESVHMPFLIRWPGVVKPGTRFTEMIQNIDYAPTFLEMAGGRAPDGLHGRSFVPVLRGETPSDWRESIYYRYFSEISHNVPQHYGVVTGRHTLFHLPETREWRLFDHEKDPHQTRNVHADPEYAAVVAELKAGLTRLRGHYGDTEEVTMPSQKPKSR